MSYKKRVRVTIVCIIIAFAVLGCVDVHEIQSSMLSESQPTAVWFSDSNMDMNADAKGKSITSDSEASDEDYPDFDLEHLSNVRILEEDSNEDYRREGNQEYSADSEGIEEAERNNEPDSGIIGENDPINRGYSGGAESVWESVPELVESEASDETGLSASLVEYGNTDNGDVAGYSEEYDDGGDSGFSENSWSEERRLTYLGDWAITAYCPCEICCGAYSSGYTASGTLATAGRTIACNSLPIGTQVMIDDCVYVVEDTGWSPYGEGWIDIYFDSHDEALTYGMRVTSVYLVG